VPAQQEVNEGGNMPIVESGLVGVPCEPSCNSPISVPRITRKRAVELVQLGFKVSEYMETLGIKEHENCSFGRIMQDLLQFPKE
jgi:hypothetical protein